ncbi:hypothetical protein CsSME_00018540 [Camellia sinensis var. sinensis]
MASIDAQLRLLAPGKVSEDDKFVEYDALLLDRFLDILQHLHGEEIRETYELDEALQREVLCFRNGKGIEGNRNGGKQIFRTALTGRSKFFDSQKFTVGELDIR